MRVTDTDMSALLGAGKRQHPRYHGSGDFTGFLTAIVKIKPKSFLSSGSPSCSAWILYRQARIRSLTASLPRESTHIPAIGASQASSCKAESSGIAAHMFPRLRAARPRQRGGDLRNLIHCPRKGCYNLS